MSPFGPGLWSQGHAWTAVAFSAGGCTSKRSHRGRIEDLNTGPALLLGA